MNKEINTIIANLEGCIGMFDYLLTPTESNLLVSYIEELQQENKQLKNNWNELKEWASNFYNSEEVGWAGCGMRHTLEKIQELEQGSDE